jgi:PilZ domain
MPCKTIILYDFLNMLNLFLETFSGGDVAMTQLSDSPDLERRSSVRRQAEYAGSIRRLRGRHHLCVIWDLSDTGARLVVPSTRGIPDKFVLEIERNRQERFYCCVMWRSECQIGVSFME